MFKTPVRPAHSALTFDACLSTNHNTRRRNLTENILHLIIIIHPQIEIRHNLKVLYLFSNVLKNIKCWDKIVCVIRSRRSAHPVRNGHTRERSAKKQTSKWFFHQRNKNANKPRFLWFISLWGLLYELKMTELLFIKRLQVLVKNRDTDER